MFLPLQALRQFQFRVGAANFSVVHVSLVPVLGVVGEQKTKPTQHSVAVLRSLGLNPTLLACRSTDPLESAVREKLVCLQQPELCQGHCCVCRAPVKCKGGGLIAVCDRCVSFTGAVLPGPATPCADAARCVQHLAGKLIGSWPFAPHHAASPAVVRPGCIHLDD